MVGVKYFDHYVIPRPSVHPSVYMSVHPLVHMSVRLSVRLSLYIYPQTTSLFKQLISQKCAQHCLLPKLFKKVRSARCMAELNQEKYSNDIFSSIKRSPIPKYVPVNILTLSLSVLLNQFPHTDAFFWLWSRRLSKTFDKRRNYNFSFFPQCFHLY